MSSTMRSIFIFLLWISGFGVEGAGRESSQYLRDSVRCDSVLLYELLARAESLEQWQPDSSLILYDELEFAATQCNNQELLLKSTFYKTFVYQNMGDPARAFTQSELAEARYREAGEERGIASAINARGTSCILAGHWQEAVVYLHQATEAFEKLELYPEMLVSLQNLTIVYASLDQHAKSEEIAHRMIEIAESLQDSLSIYKANISILNSMLNQDRMEEADLYMEICDQLADFELPPTVRVDHMITKGQWYQRKGELEKARLEKQKAYNLSLELNTPTQIIRSLHSLATVLHMQKNSFKAITYWEEAVSMCTTFSLSSDLVEILKFLSEAYKATGQTTRYIESLEEYIATKDSLQGLESEKYIHFLQNRYQAERKERLIRELEHDNELHLMNLNLKVRNIRVRNILLLCLLVGLILLVWLGVQRMKIKDKEQLLLKRESEIQRVQLTSLKQQYEMNLLEAGLRGQEDERKRLARDLHDGLGGTLNAVRLCFDHLLGRQDAYKEEMDELKSMIDHSCKELRLIAHNLRPDLFLSKGFITVLKNYFRQMETFYGVKIQLNMLDEAKSDLPLRMATDCFRSIQELIVNAIKHGQAQRIDISMILEDDMVTVMVEDNGRGVQGDVEPSGIGLASIRERTRLWGGEMVLEQPGERGFSVTLTFNSKNPQYETAN